MALTARSVVVARGAVCFGCNQGFEGNPVARQFDTDLLDPAHATELRGLCFHPGHLANYARRRGWNELLAFLHEHGAKNF